MTQTNTTQDLTEEQIQREINKRGGIDPRGKINDRRNQTTNTTQNKEELSIKTFKLPLWKRIIFWFLPRYYGVDMGCSHDKTVQFMCKKFRGQIYILEVKDLNDR